jgi:membrane protein
MSKLRPSGIVDLVRESFIGWSRNEATLHAAALAYYTIFSLAPLLIISIGIATQVFSQAAVEGRIVKALDNVVGSEAAVVVEEIIKNSHYLLPNSLATGLTLLFLLYGSSSMFRQIRYSLNAMWGVTARAETVQESLITMAKNYLLSATAVLIVGLVVLASLLMNAVWTAVPEPYLQALLPNFEELVPLIRFIASPVMFMVVFVIVFKTMPKAKIRWRDTWLGSAVTALLFWLGSYLIGLYLSYSVWTSIYGAASSLIAFLIWIYYSAWIFLFGAKFTQVYANKVGRPIVPDADAMFIESTS